MATLKQAPFTRVLREGEQGIDVEGVGRALARGGYGDLTLAQFNKLPLTSRRTFGKRKVAACKELERDKGHKVDGRYELAQHKALLPAFDARAANFMVLFVPPAAICYPLPLGAQGGECQGNHETSGLPGNWARDWCIPEITGNGTAILAVEDAIVTRLSGKDPNQDVPDGSGTFGWSIYYTTRAGYQWYWTHFGKRAIVLGEKIRAGQIIGWIGDQDFRPDHIHGGVSSPKGEVDARRHLAMIAAARRVKPLPLAA